MKYPILLLLGIALLTGTTFAQDAAYRFEEGKEYTYLIEETNLTIQEVQGQTMTQNTESIIRATYKLLELLENGNLRMQAKIDNAMVIVESPSETKTIGGDMTGKTVDFEIQSDGKLADIDESIREIEGDGIMVLIAATNIFPELESKNLKEGGEWKTSKIDTTAGGSITNDQSFEYTVKGRKDVNGVDCLEIAMKTSAKQKGTISRGDQDMSLTGSQDGTATILYSNDLGVTVGYESDVTVDQTIVIHGNNMRVPVTATKSLKIELVE